MPIPEDREDAKQYYLNILEKIDVLHFKSIIEAVRIMTEMEASEERDRAKYENYETAFKTLLKSIEESTGGKGITTDTSIFYEYITQYFVDIYDEDAADSEYLNKYISDCLKASLTNYMAMDEYVRSGGRDSGHNVHALSGAFAERITQILNHEGSGRARGGGGIKRSRTKRSRTKRRRTKRRKSNKTRKRKSRRTRKRRSRR